MTWGFRKKTNICLVEIWTKGWSIVNELEMLDMPWFNVKKGKTGDRNWGRCMETYLSEYAKTVKMLLPT